MEQSPVRNNPQRKRRTPRNCFVTSGSCCAVGLRGKRGAIEFRTGKSISNELCWRRNSSPPPQQEDAMAKGQMRSTKEKKKPKQDKNKKKGGAAAPTPFAGMHSQAPPGSFGKKN
jgi:hypothetical protein